MGSMIREMMRKYTPVCRTRLQLSISQITELAAKPAPSNPQSRACRMTALISFPSASASSGAQGE